MLPNQHDHPYNEIGPIYVHDNERQPYLNHEEFPPELRTRRPLVLRCYSDNGMLVGGELVGDRAVEDVIRTLFDNSEVKYLHARTASVGCYSSDADKFITYDGKQMFLCGRALANNS